MLADFLRRTIDRSNRHFGVVLRTDVAAKLAEGRTIMWQGRLIYESARYATGVLTDEALFLNSANSAKETEHTELQLTFLRERVKAAQWQPLGLLRFFSFFIWGVFDHTAWLRLTDGTSKRLFFPTEKEAIAFCEAINQWVGATCRLTGY